MTTNPPPYVVMETILDVCVVAYSFAYTMVSADFLRNVKVEIFTLF